MDFNAHRSIGIAAAAGVGVALGVPLVGCALMMFMSGSSSSFPDQAEKPFRKHWKRKTKKLRAREIPVTTNELWFSRQLARHRTWTHWPSLWLVLSILLAMLITYAGQQVVDVIMTTHPHGFHPHQVMSAVEGLAWLTSAGLFIGCSMHSVADACTDWGSPLCGPFKRKRYHITPENMRIGDHGDDIVGHIAIAATFGLVAFQLMT
jgi:membrane-bound metal-dependent hydrolase YbcI (DUF457 family)